MPITVDIDIDIDIDVMLAERKMFVGERERVVRVGITPAHKQADEETGLRERKPGSRRGYRSHDDRLLGAAPPSIGSRIAGARQCSASQPMPWLSLAG
ncbi:hypothetical protein [Streptomyces sp. NPDC090036]|uniref:hypothetical protein n=1 Tax=Streptomyces sp. NPDC090036 TaxID=3365926 RepID=UPI0037F1305F